jgi:hypothetical protein
MRPMPVELAIAISVFKWTFFVFGGYICILNFYISFLRYRVHLWRGLSKESFKFVSGIPLLGSLIVYLLLRYMNLPPAMQYVAIGLIVIDTGGIHWGIGNVVYHSFLYFKDKKKP